MIFSDYSKLPDTSVEDVQSSRKSDQPLRKRGVLVVDDNPMILKMLNFALRKRDFEVWQAHSGYEALETLQANRDRVDLILTDVRMPGLDGPQTFAACRNICPDIPCCFMSGDLGDYSNTHLMELGVRKVFQKPFQIDELCQTIAELIGPVKECETASEASSRRSAGD